MRTNRLLATGLAVTIASCGLATVTTPAQALTVMCAVPTWVTPIQGTPGDDVIQGTDGVDVIYGNGGNDTIYGKGGNDVIDGGDGADVIYGAEGNDCLMGGAGRDTMFGGQGDDRQFGQAGDDTIETGDAAPTAGSGTPGDYVDGGDGSDTLSYSTPYFTYDNVEILTVGKGWYGA